MLTRWETVAIYGPGTEAPCFGSTSVTMSDYRGMGDVRLAKKSNVEEQTGIQLLGPSGRAMFCSRPLSFAQDA